MWALTGDITFKGLVSALRPRCNTRLSFAVVYLSGGTTTRFEHEVSSRDARQGISRFPPTQPVIFGSLVSNAETGRGVG
jgi:hypothetical protein